MKKLSKKNVKVFECECVDDMPDEKSVYDTTKMWNYHHQIQEKYMGVKKEILKEQNERRLDILEYQYELLIKGKKKDRMNEIKRKKASEKTIVTQMILEKNLSDFVQRMNTLKDQSVYKKTPEQRYKIYKDLKRAEAEKRKKELEDKLDKLLSKQ